ncbi:hypothetical protein GQ54DRAFT_300927 [Martensiomyces pterosporus]|nr:hypothetical protein GQ54DRAFT_300927 [Martensiomyces pterosporus]
MDSGGREPQAVRPQHRATAHSHAVHQATAAQNTLALDMVCQEWWALGATQGMCSTTALSNGATAEGVHALEHAVHAFTSSLCEPDKALLSSCQMACVIFSFSSWCCWCCCCFCSSCSLLTPQLAFALQPNSPHLLETRDKAKTGSSKRETKEENREERQAKRRAGEKAAREQCVHQTVCCCVGQHPVWFLLGATPG